MKSLCCLKWDQQHSVLLKEKWINVKNQEEQTEKFTLLMCVVDFRSFQCSSPIFLLLKQPNEHKIIIMSPYFSTNRLFNLVFSIQSPLKQWKDLSSKSLTDITFPQTLWIANKTAGSSHICGSFLPFSNLFDVSVSSELWKNLCSPFKTTGSWFKCSCICVLF